MFSSMSRLLLLERNARHEPGVHDERPRLRAAAGRAAATRAGRSRGRRARPRPRRDPAAAGAASRPASSARRWSSTRASWLPSTDSARKGRARSRARRASLDPWRRGRRPARSCRTARGRTPARAAASSSEQPWTSPMTIVRDMQLECSPPGAPRPPGGASPLTGTAPARDASHHQRRSPCSKQARRHPRSR